MPSRRSPTPAAARPKETHFGFRRVSEDEKTRLVHDVFAQVATRYDTMNDAMSLGAHRLWKTGFVDWLAPRAGMRVLDVGGGTGDIARRVARGGCSVVVCDINGPMLAAGRARTAAAAPSIRWVQGDAERLPIAETSVDAWVSAFCLRNVTRLEAALAEARRVLKPGGRFLCLEFSRVSTPWLARAYDAYSFAVIPRLGAAIAGDRDAYRYLVESIRRFPDQERFASMIRNAGLERIEVRDVFGGIAAMHSAWRL